MQCVLQGKLLPTPEQVPFRLRGNVADGLGVLGVEGPFRRCCEHTMNVVRGAKEHVVAIIEVSAFGGTAVDACQWRSLGLGCSCGLVGECRIAKWKLRGGFKWLVWQTSINIYTNVLLYVKYTIHIDLSASATVYQPINRPDGQLCKKLSIQPRKVHNQSTMR